MLLVFKITLKRFLIIGYVNKYKNERINSLINSEKNNQLSQPFVLKVDFKKLQYDKRNWRINFLLLTPAWCFSLWTSYWVDSWNFLFHHYKKKKKLSIKQEMNEIKSSNYNYFEDKDLLSFLIGYKIHITQF